MNKDEDPKWFKPVFLILLIIFAILAFRVVRKNYDPGKHPYLRGIRLF